MRKNKQIIKVQSYKWQCDKKNRITLLLINKNSGRVINKEQNSVTTLRIIKGNNNKKKSTFEL